MNIKRITNQHRRDFDAILQCEHCNHEQKLEGGYDDAYYHQNVLPNIKCKKCNKTAGDNYIEKATKYPEGVQI